MKPKVKSRISLLNVKIDIAEEHIERRNFLMYCSSCLLDIVNYIDENKIVREDLHFENESLKAEFEEKCNIFTEDEKVNWLIENGCKNDIYNLYYKHLFCSLVVDFSNYYNASVEMAYNGNIYVAWALLRKPFQETLAYLEWLYVDRNELLTLMVEQGDTKKYDLTNKANKEKIRSYISKIYPETEDGEIDLYKFRYSYDEELTINGILQATNHLITSRPVLKTSSHGMNFIFHTDDAVNQNIGFYYTSVPYVMLNAMKTILQMFFEMTGFDEHSQEINLLNLFLKNFEAMPIDFGKARKLLQLDDIAIRCPHCNTSFSTDEKWIDFTNNRFKCNKCLHEIHTGGLIFDYILNNTEE